MQSTKNKIGGRMKNNLNQRASSRWVIALGFAALTAVGCAGGPLTAREKGAGIGAVGGAAAGGLIGAAAGRPALGAAIGGGVGLGAGALIGDYMQGQEETQYQYNQQQIQQNQRVIEQNRRDVQTQRQRQEY
jgi:phage tail tape-measure protein